MPEQHESHVMRPDTFGKYYEMTPLAIKTIQIGLDHPTEGVHKLTAEVEQNPYYLVSST